MGAVEGLNLGPAKKLGDIATVELVDGPVAR